jgi:dipeptidyl aminopeptidase/acylaminoacyl peptidase
MRLLKYFGCPIHRSFIAMSGIAGFLLSTASLFAQEPKPFTLQQVLSAPYASQLTAAPTGPLFAWTEDAEGRHNLFVGGKDIPARQLTHNTEDDAQDISQLAWSPDAKFIAYTFGAPSGADGKPANPAHLQRPTPVEVIIQPVDGSAPTIVGEGHAPLFTRDGKNLLSTRGGQIWMTCLEDCHPSRSGGYASPTEPQKSSEQLVFDRGTASSLTLSPDGQTLAFISRRREANEPSHSFLALYSFATHTLTFPAANTGNDSAPAFSPDGKQLAWLRSPFTDFPEFANPRTSATPWSIQLLSLADGKTSKLFSPEPNKPGSVLPNPGGHDPYLLWTADHRLIFPSTADGWVHLYSIGSEHFARLMTPGAFDISEFGNDPGQRGILYVSNEAEDDATDTDRSHIRFMPFVHRDDIRGSILLTSGAGIESRPYTFSSTTKSMPVSDDVQKQYPLAYYGLNVAALAASPVEPMHPVIFDGTGRMKPLHPFGSATKFYPATFLVTPQQVIFLSTDNLQIHSQLFLPKNLDSHKKNPAILFLHGGPMRQMLLGYPAMDYYSNAYAMNQYLTSRGFIVLSVNYRCGIGYGLNFHQCEGEGATGAKEYDDVLAAAKYLQSRPDVDSKRIGLWGGSYGGYLTALGLARNSDIFAAGVDFHGVHDWNLEDNASDWKQGSFAEQDAIAAKALASSPLGDISKWSSPILLIHGDNDPDVAYAQTPHLADALRARNSKLPPAQQVDVQELIFPDELHGFLLHRDWLAAYTAAAAFFERTLRPNQ